MYEIRVSIPLISVLELGSARLLLAHRREIDGLPIWKHQLVFLIIYEAVFFFFFSLLLVTLDSHLVCVFASNTVRINVSVFTACYAIHANRFFLVRSVIVLEAPRDRTVRVVVPVSPDDLQNILLLFVRH